MDDLAREAGSSRTVVSRVFNGKSNVSAEVRARILETAKKLNYRNMANNHQIRIGLVISGFTGEYGVRIVRAVMDAAYELGWICLPFERRNLKGLDHLFLDGVVSMIIDQKFVRRWDKQNLPLVMMNSYTDPVEHICSVDPDRIQEAELVLNHLKSLGHRKIAHIYLSNPAIQHRGCDEFLQVAARLNLGDSAVNFEYPDDEPLEKILPEILKQGFTAIFMIHQNLALRSVKIIQNAGYRIPEDVSLITYERKEVSEYMTPPLTTIDYDYDALARRALAELRLRMLGRKVGGSSIRIPNILTIRNSTGPCRKD